MLFSVIGKPSLIIKSRDESMKDSGNNINRIWKSDRFLKNQKQDTHKVPLHLECNLFGVYLVSFTVSNMNIIFCWNKMSAVRLSKKSPADFMKL